MADIHIDDFYRDVAKILIRLYAIFPRKTALYVEDISGPDEPDEFGLHHPRFQACFSTMVWLAEHGYITYQDTIRQEALDLAVLRQKAFLLLTTRSSLSVAGADPDLPPSILEAAQTNIAQLRAAAREGSSTVLRQCVGYLLAHPPVGGH
ncbi:MAG: hypothetical protein R3E50_04435 [Halioglobus sp.]